MRKDPSLRRLRIAALLAATALASCTRLAIRPLGEAIEAPAFSPAVPSVPLTAAPTISLSSSQAGVTIRYSTTKGATIGDSSWKDYSAPFVVDSSTTLSAYAFIDESNPSPLVSGDYRLKVPAPVITARPSLDVQPLLVDMDCALEGATIRYTTDGSTPTGTSTLYSPFPWEIDGATIKAYATRTGWLDSDVSATTIAIDTGGALLDLNLSASAGSYDAPFTLDATTTSPDAIVRYTTDGSTPTFLAGMDFPSAGLYIDASCNLTIASMRAGSAAIVQSASYVMTVATPSFSVAAGNHYTDQALELATTTPGATIRYTTDGTDPLSSGSAQTYSGTPIAIGQSMTVTAAATKAGWTSSTGAARTYTMVATAPVLSLAAGSYASDQALALSTTTPGATIRYTTDGTDPLSSGSAQTYSGTPIAIGQSMTVTAAATRAGWTPAAAAARTYTMVATAPVLSLAAGSYASDQALALSTTTPGATIRYTTDGTDPLSSGSAQTYSGTPIAIGQSMTVTAAATRAGWTPAAAAARTYTMVATAPAMSVAAGTYNSGQSLALYTSTPGSVIIYTTDGSDPLISGTAATSTGTAVVVDIVKSGTLRAVTRKTNWNDSAEASAAYVLKVPNPTASPAGGTGILPATVTLSSGLAGAAVYYTVDGSDPVPGTSPLYSAPFVLAAPAPKTLKILATYAGWSDSDIVALAFN